MRPIRTLVVWVLLLFSAAAGWCEAPPEKAAPTIPTFRQAKSWQIKYTYTTAGESAPTPATLVVSFLAPDRMTARNTASYMFTAVSDHDSIHVFFPELNAAMWTPAAYSFDLPQIGLTMGGTDGPLSSMDWKMVEGALRQPGGKLGGATYELLPEEEVAGRKCLVLRMRVGTNSPDGQAQEWVTTRWFDAEYGLPLAIRSGAGKRRLEARAKSAAVDLDLQSDLFTPKVPRSVPTFRGALECCDVTMIGEALSYGADEDESASEPPEVPGATTVLQPGSAPAGFRSTGSPSTGCEPGAEARQWSYSLKWFSRSGGVIGFDQGVGDVEERNSRLTGERRSVTVRDRPGVMLSYHVPFDGLVLTWEDGARWFKLEGTGVTAEDLLKMAELMKEVKVAPAPKTRATPPSSRRSTPGAQ
jgi:hypothetical protein